MVIISAISLYRCNYFLVGTDRCYLIIQDYDDCCYVLWIVLQIVLTRQEHNLIAKVNSVLAIFTHAYFIWGLYTHIHRCIWHIYPFYLSLRAIFIVLWGYRYSNLKPLFSSAVALCCYERCIMPGTATLISKWYKPLLFYRMHADLRDTLENGNLGYGDSV